MALADRIRQERKAIKLTQEAVARRSGMTLNGYADIERGRARDPHLSTVVAISKALGVPLCQLLED